MPNLDLSFTITAIIALTSLISPIITCLINNHHQLKIKELELKQQAQIKLVDYKKEIFENYLKYAGAYVYNCNAEVQTQYGKYSFLAMTYAPKNISNEIELINENLLNLNYESAIIKLNLLTISIRSFLQQLEKEYQ